MKNPAITTHIAASRILFDPAASDTAKVHLVVNETSRTTHAQKGTWGRCAVNVSAV